MFLASGPWHWKLLNVSFLCFSKLSQPYLWLFEVVYLFYGVPLLCSWARHFIHCFVLGSDMTKKYCLDRKESSQTKYLYTYLLIEIYVSANTFSVVSRRSFYAAALFCLNYSILNVPANNFQSCQDVSSCSMQRLATIFLIFVLFSPFNKFSVLSVDQVLSWA